ncbi:hypothetical protein J699_03176 [Acinetobacter sp. 1000160]|nr:hypothetical protein J522_3454 [Acinetobacter baumannii 146457]EYT16431.1 hypothetical protein J699_03176 [Acinetobacter sp. 1000160]
MYMNTFESIVKLLKLNKFLSFNCMTIILLNGINYDSK